jgi:crotonobetainyl-CoA:carnitine CoA-transferase CaiB-like acyl-CoA transferase
MATQNFPLLGIRVIELASVLAGPSVGMFLAELGAEVLKVESPGVGDVTRTWKLAIEREDTRTPAYFCAVNWGKRYLQLDLKNAKDRATLHALVPETDIVICSFKPGDADKLGMDYETLSALNERLIYGEISGYGQGDARVGYDAIIQAEAGFMFMNGEADGPPVKMPVALMDVLAAHHLKAGILTALYQRERSGLGDRISVSLLDAGIASLVNQATNYLVAGHVPQRMGSAHPNIAPYGTVFTCADGKQIVPAIGTDRQFATFMRIIGLPEFASDLRFLDNASRVKHRDVLEQKMHAAIAEFPRSVLLQSCAEAGVPVGGVHDMQDVFALPESQNMVLRSGSLSGVRSVAFRSARMRRVEDLHPPM